MRPRGLILHISKSGTNLSFVVDNRSGEATIVPVLAIKRALMKFKRKLAKSIYGKSRSFYYKTY